MTTQEQAQQLAEKEFPYESNIIDFQESIYEHLKFIDDKRAAFIKGFLAASAQQGWVSAVKQLPEAETKVLLLAKDKVTVKLGRLVILRTGSVWQTDKKDFYSFEEYISWKPLLDLLEHPPQPHDSRTNR